MFGGLASNKTVSITISENGGFIIQYYSDLDTSQDHGPIPQGIRFQMRVLTAISIEDAVNLVREVLSKIK